MIGVRIGCIRIAPSQTPIGRALYASPRLLGTCEETIPHGGEGVEGKVGYVRYPKRIGVYVIKAGIDFEPLRPQGNRKAEV